MSQNTVESQTTLPGYARKVWIVAGIFALVVVLLILFKTILSVLMLTLAGVLMAVYFHGFAHLIRRFLGSGPKWSLALSVIINMAIIGLFSWFVGYRLQAQMASLADTLPSELENAKEMLKQSPVGGRLLDFLNSSGDNQKAMGIARNFFSSSFGILSDLYIVILLGVFFTAGPGVYRKGFIKLMPAGAKRQTDSLLHELTKVLSNWLKGQLFGFAFIAVLTGLGLWAIGMPLILTLALIAGLLNFIPNFGPIIAVVPALLLALTQGTTAAILVVCLYTGIQIVQSAVTQPLIQQKMVNIPPALIVFGQVAMGLIAGFWGILLATPVVAIIMTIVNRLYVDKQADA
ncbi:MAG: AI-2E family transporter [Chitinophagaceae bacterium]